MLFDTVRVSGIVISYCRVVLAPWRTAASTTSRLLCRLGRDDVGLQVRLVFFHRTLSVLKTIR
jgi:hypothetical protein